MGQPENNHFLVDEIARITLTIIITSLIIVTIVTAVIVAIMLVVLNFCHGGDSMIALPCSALLCPALPLLAYNMKPAARRMLLTT